MEDTEYVIKFTCSCFNQKWNFAPHFLEFYSFRVLWKCENANSYNSPTRHLFA